MISSMTFSMSVIAQTNDFENITVEQNEDGETVLILNPDQYVAIWDHIESLEYELEKKEAELEQAKEEIEKAYNQPQKNSVDISSVALSATAIIAIIASLSK